MTNKAWIKPPAVYDVNIPSNQSMTKITAIVSNTRTSFQENRDNTASLLRRCTRNARTGEANLFRYLRRAYGKKVPESGS